RAARRRTAGRCRSASARRRSRPGRRSVAPLHPSRTSNAPASTLPAPAIFPGAAATEETMEHRQFGRSGLRVSALSLGAMTFGEARGFMKGVHSDDAESRRVFDAALDAGIDTVDTANGYSEGRSEELLGQWMKGKRQAITLATKCRFPTLGGIAPMHSNESGLS